MNRLPILALLGLLATSLAACGDGLPSAPNPASLSEARLQEARGHTAERPFRGSCEVDVTAFIPLELGSDGQLLRARQLIEGTCQLTHLGTTAVHLDQVTDYTVFPSRSTSTQAYTAANGDQLFAEGISFNGAPDGHGNVTFTGTLTATGGTGRFENASGSADASGGFNLRDLTGFYSLDGAIIYAASNQSGR